MLKIIIKLGCCVFIGIFLVSCANISSKKDNKTAAEYNAQLGLAYLERGDVVRAKRKLLVALDIDRNNAIIFDAMAYFYEKTGNEGLAKKYYLKALDFAPQSGKVLNNYGTFLCRNGHYKTSIHYFLLAANDASYLHPATAYMNASKCAAKVPDLVLSESLLEKASKAGLRHR